MRDIEQWAADEFGDAELGDRRRTERLVVLAAEVARTPAGTVTRACHTSASREGAFRWLENSEIRPDAVLSATRRATLRRCAGLRRVHVPLDGTALTLTDKKRSKGLGPVGQRDGAQGVHFMTAFAVSSEGKPLGVVGQRSWVRNATKTAKRSAPVTSETDHWLELLRRTHREFEEQSPDCEAFYQLDRGADSGRVLSLAVEKDLLLTVRAAYDRNVDTKAGRLWKEVSAAPKRAVFRLKIRARTHLRKRRRVGGRRIEWRVNRRARMAKMEVRAIRVPLLFKNHTRLEMNAVLVRERGRRKTDRVEWMLLTTHAIKTRAEVLSVVEGYVHRWRIEELHRTWKRGLCRVEDTQLRSTQAILKWAIILAAVAARAMHLTYLARQEPDRPALNELSKYELEALIVLREPKNIRIGDAVTLAQAVRWLADLGGYMNPHQGPPGPTVVGRGLDYVLPAARALQNRDKMR
jgi:hypothetical protein